MQNPEVLNEMRGGILMANVMITQRCNLSCPYCFANEFTNNNTNDITIENFIKALDFIKTDPNELE